MAVASVLLGRNTARFVGVARRSDEDQGVGLSLDAEHKSIYD